MNENKLDSAEIITIVENEIESRLSQWRREGREKEAEGIGRHARLLFLIGLDCFALGYNHGLNINYDGGKK